MIEFLFGVAVGTGIALFNLSFLLYYWHKEDRESNKQKHNIQSAETTHPLSGNNELDE